jgi:NAD(P)-dependent dehydrogenase (short-subunit alcohol dehydrogenase family)
MAETTSKVLMVTGASRGIGRAVAIMAGSRNHAVGVNYVRDRAAADSVVAEIRQAGGRAVALQGDIADAASVERIFDQLGEAFGPLNALVANAGVTPPRMGFDEASIEDLERIVQVNLMGTIYCMRRAATDLRRAGGGAIVAVSSEAARFGGNQISTYAATKAAINALVVGTARELGRHGIRVNAVSPGVVRTDALPSGDDAQRAALERSVPLGRAGRADEVAETILWLLSDAASYVSGAALPVSGAR